MNLHYQWVRFRRECLRGQTRQEISAAKLIFYAGACAAGDTLLRNFNPTGVPTPGERRAVEFIRQSLIKFQQQQKGD